MMTGLEKFFKTLRLGVQLGTIFVITLTLMADTVWAADSSEDELVVFPEGLPCVMKRVPTDSGERFEAEGDPSTFFLSDGATAVLKISGHNYPKYVLIRNFSDEDDFTLTVDGKNYAMKSAISASGAKYEAENDPSTSLWNKGKEVFLEIGGKEYLGYDIWRPDREIWLSDPSFPTELEWKVASIADLEVIPGSTVTLTFHSDGKLSGKASINNFTSLWIASGYKILITNGISTKMAGSKELMDQEERFLTFLSGIDRFEFRKEGVALINKDDEEILLKR
ncbi:MAG: META domain-containing protein [Synergistaceae bacterium]|jgi:heat shock protein HslJ|nr:META domain-containing protein [Synergistaceae bacterium]